MDKKKTLQQTSSSSEETDSSDADENEEAFIRRDRQQRSADRAVRVARQKAEGEEEGEDSDQIDRDDLNEIDGTQRARSSETSSSDDENSETTSASESSKHFHQAVVLRPGAEKGNVSREKKETTAEVIAKPKVKPDLSPMKRKDKAFNRDREEQSVGEKSPSKKQKDEKSNLTAKSIEYVPKGKDSAKDNRIKETSLDKKVAHKKFAHGSASIEKPEHLSAQPNSAKKFESTPAEKGKNVKKVAKNEDPEIAKGSASPPKYKLFTGKDEIVLMAEVWHDVQKGFDVPSKKTDDYWSKLAERVDGRMEGSWSKEQLCEKLKRMRQRYLGMAEKFKNTGERKFRNTIDEELYAMWDKMWCNCDAMKTDRGDVQNKKSQSVTAPSPVKAGKASRNKVVAPVQDVRVMKGEPEAHKTNTDSSQSEESDGDRVSLNKDLAVGHMEMDLRGGHADGSMSHSVNQLQGILREEIHATLAEVQESSRQTLRDWQSKALTVVEIALKAFTNQARSMTALDIRGFDGPSIPLRNLDLSDSHLHKRDYTLQQQWRELHLKELEVYRQTLELVQRECQLKEDRLKALLQEKE